MIGTTLDKETRPTSTSQQPHKPQQHPPYSPASPKALAATIPSEPWTDYDAVRLIPFPPGSFNLSDS